MSDDEVRGAYDEIFRAEKLRLIDEAEAFDPTQFTTEEWKRLRALAREAPLDQIGRDLYALPFAILPAEGPSE